MTFSKPRFTEKYQFEVIRFCTSAPVIGAASKLFKHFVKTYNPHSVISYSDNRWGDGQVYSKLGMTRISETIGFFYTDYRQRINRMRLQKHKMVAEGADASLTEFQIAQSLGYDRIWDCGQTAWVWRAAQTAE